MCVDSFDFTLQNNWGGEGGGGVGSEIRKLWQFKDSDCPVGARVSNTAGTRSCCIPELLAQKRLKVSNHLFSTCQFADGLKRVNIKNSEEFCFEILR